MRKLSNDDWWPEWFRKRRRSPFFRRSFFGDIDEIFREMEEMMSREFRDLSQRAPRDLIRERTLPDGSKVKSWGPFVYGYSVTMGSDGKPKIREFGNIKPETWKGRPHIDVKDKREPLTDVMTTNGEVKVIVELPGVEKKDIKLHGTDNDLTITVDTPERKYYKKIEMPDNADPKKAKSSYKNGVLDITIPKKKEKKPEGEPIEIE